MRKIERKGVIKNARKGQLKCIIQERERGLKWENG
jgi:hypothetical protein